MKKRRNPFLPLYLLIVLLLLGLAVGNALRLKTLRVEIESLNAELTELRSQASPDDRAFSIDEIEPPPPPPEITDRILFSLPN